MNQIEKIRPQIMIAMMVLGAVALYALNIGAIEVVTGATGGMIALGMKILENNGNE